MKHVVFLILLFLTFLLVHNCNHGLSPSSTKKTNPDDLSGISGAIVYQNWPPGDSLKDLRLVAFRDFPPQNIFVEIITGNAIVYPPIDTSAHLQFNVQFEEYIMELPPDTFEYIVVAHQFGEDRFSQDSWQAVGQYDTDSDSLPTPIVVIEDSLLENINITVDFKNRPIQPFENR
ncbi:MAG: hypothetical protein GWN00_29920 [Aliifodinibius sp.]|nr:hypothetical protein [Fodinibius sp.]NIV15010.1 hypothetical protein [Fodinibius sp.]NIY28856.1 hypothetical protein [Fodinibius sp.]